MIWDVGCESTPYAVFDRHMFGDIVATKEGGMITGEERLREYLGIADTDFTKKH